MKTYLADALILVGFLLILGTAGAADLGNIELTQILVQSVIGLAFVVGGFFGMAYIAAQEGNKDEQ